jgi:SAM-dependent methyltransferase
MPERLIPSDHAEWRKFGHQHLQRYRFAHDRIEGPRVLDLACGVGYGSYILAQGRDRQVTGIDLDAQAVAYGHAHYEHPNLRLLEGNALTWRHDGPLFDTIVSFETIEHLPDAPAFVARIASLLAPDGLLLISAPNALQHTRAPVPVANEFHLSEPDYAEFRRWLEPFFTIESEWEQSPVNVPGLEELARLRHDTETLQSRWWLRAANRLEGAWRRLGGGPRPPTAVQTAGHFLAVTDILPLLPERRAQCEVFVFACRRRKPSAHA